MDGPLDTPWATPWATPPLVPGYQVVGVIGQGGFATVYRAVQLAVGREVALKLDHRVLASERDRPRFIREVTAAGQPSGHPHVVAVYDAGVLADGRPYLVLELCPGGSLAQRLRAQGPLAPAEARDVGTRIADALAAAHAAGVLHRDVKPANILVNRYGMVALADFGLAAMPAPGAELSATREALTPAYAAPELFRLAVPSPAGDVYALGATLYALLCGRPPHFPANGQPGLAQIMELHHQPVPDLPGVPRALTGVLRHAMAFDPAERPIGAAALRDELASVSLAGLAGPPGGDGAGPGAVAAGRGRARARHRRRRAVGLAAGLLAVALAAGLAFVVAGGRGATSRGQGGRSGGQATGGQAPAAVTVLDGTPAVTRGCPAAAVAGAHARCPVAAECWSGMVAVLGTVDIKRVACEEPHYWETFALAPLPLDALTYDQEALERHPLIRQVCALDVLLRSRYGRARSVPAGRWQADALPPGKDAFQRGVRVYRCVGSVIGDPVPGTSFRPPKAPAGG